MALFVMIVEYNGILGGVKIMRKSLALWLVLVVALTFNSSVVLAISTFNEFGISENSTSVEQLPKVDEDNWIEYPSTNNVSLDKTWKITFNTKIKEKQVKAAVIIIDGELIPVTITGFNTNQLQVKATYNLPGAKSGEMKIYLSNGKNYKISFTTKDEVRKVEGEGTLRSPIPLLKEEKVEASIQQGVTAYYSIRITEAGLLKINNNWNGIEDALTTRLLYNSPDHKRYTLPTLENEEKYTSILVNPGEYYLSVSNRQKDPIIYDLITSFEKTDLATDKVHSEFEHATMLVDDQLIEESLATFNGTDFDEVDMYKFIVEKDGNTRIQLESSENKTLFMSIYDSNQQLIEERNFIKSTVYSKNLLPGTYYVWLSGYRDQKTYKLTKSFKEVMLTDNEQQRLKDLKAKWQIWKPVYEGVQSTGTSVEHPYSYGEVHPKAELDALNVTKMIRYTTGLSTDVSLNAEYSKRAQAAALLNALNGGLSHYPQRPDNVTDEQYDVGYLGASKSNLSMGRKTIYDTVVHGYMSDASKSNVSTVGHRRWILSPYLPEIGFGAVDRFSAMYVISENYPRSIPHYETIVWPVENVMPLEFFHDNDPWSISFNPQLYKVKIEDLTVLYTLNGETQTLTAQNTNDFYLNQGNYGYTPLTLIFRTNEIKPIVYGDRVKIEVRGLKDAYGNDKPFSYETIFLHLENNN